jgi:sulfite reductase (NADPH) flavoprotein alpha-component
MLAPSKINIVQELLADLSREEVIWLHGYLAGVVSKEPEASPVINNLAVKKITIAYGTETGNTKKLATRFTARAKQNGMHTRLIGLDQYKLNDLEKEEWLFIIISTHGEGEPPDAARRFYDHLHQQKLSLPSLRYGVLALGDTAYPLFCKAGEDVDQQLQKLGASRVQPLKKCDVDFENDAEEWFKTILQALKKHDIPGNERIQPLVKLPASSTTKKEKKYYDGKILSNINLNARGSAKQTFHLEIGLDEPADYLPGDSLAIIPTNRKDVVAEIVRLTGIDPLQTVTLNQLTGTVEELLVNHLNICYLLTSTVKSYAEITKLNIPDTRMDLKDLLRIYPVKDAGQFLEVLSILKPIAPRLYSISSSPAAHPGEIHLTVSKHWFLLQDEQHYGLCSAFLGDQPAGTPIRFYIHKNNAFKLPVPAKDIIMVGAGTGIAPFRSFIAERDVTGAEGRSWIFFGDQHFTTDFLYQSEWQDWLNTGSLTKMNVAFSRDQPEKIYVQHKMLEHAAQLMEWLDKGAYFYICGARDPLSGAVESTLRNIISLQKNYNEEEATQYLAQLKKEGRYQKDVY